MKNAIKSLLVAVAMLVVGCGGDKNTKNDTDKAYQNQKLPSVKDEAIPDVLLGGNSSSSLSQAKLSSQADEVSAGFTTLKEKAQFFYKKQLEINMELGYMDSVWGQIEDYCQGKSVCNIPSGKIVFTYTEALYARDMQLIETYEGKTGDTMTYGDYKNDMKSLVGTKFKLLSAKLTVDEGSEYTYVLETEHYGFQAENPNIEYAIVKWSDGGKQYLVREEIVGTIDGKRTGTPSWVQYEYRESDGNSVNIFTAKDNFLGYDNEYLKFGENEDGSIYFTQDYPTDQGPFHAEGILTSEGGEVTFSGPEGYYLHETFDREGRILTSTSCNPENALDSDSCSIQDPAVIKKILLENIYTLSSPFWGEDEETPTSAPVHHTMLRFDENDTMFAVVNCSTYVADYRVGEYGISFSNVKKTVSPELKCLYPQIQSNFEKMLENGLPFMQAVDDPIHEDQHFNPAFGFFPNLESTSREDFNIESFYEKLYANEYVDSPLMNNVLKIRSASWYSNLNSGKYFLLLSSPEYPEIHVENKKIHIDLIDATFDADIEVIDSTHIKFVNIHRVDKSDVEYPEDTDSNCQEEDTEEGECEEDPNYDSTNSDKIFAGIVERFLNETISVSSGVTDYFQIRFTGSEMAFTGDIEDR
jgi:hypothetical protein